MKALRPDDKAPRNKGRFFSGKNLFVLFTVLLLSLADGMLTMSLLEKGAWEANPIMRFALSVSREFFLILKYFLTASGVLFLLRFGDKKVFSERISLEEIAGLFIVFYEGLVIYEITLWHLM